MLLWGSWRVWHNQHTAGRGNKQQFSPGTERLVIDSCSHFFPIIPIQINTKSLFTRHIQVWKFYFRKCFHQWCNTAAQYLWAIFNLLSLSPPRGNRESRSGVEEEIIIFSVQYKTLRSWCGFVMKLEWQVNIQDVMQCMETPVWRRQAESWWALVCWLPAGLVSEPTLHCSVPASCLNIGQTCIWVRKLMRCTG